jgi:hypothetical protein
MDKERVIRNNDVVLLELFYKVRGNNGFRKRG